MSKLHDDNWYEIGKYLYVDMILRLHRVSKRLNTIYTSNDIWKMLYLRDIDKKAPYLKDYYNTYKTCVLYMKLRYMITHIECSENKGCFNLPEIWYLKHNQPGIVKWCDYYIFKKPPECLGGFYGYEITFHNIYGFSESIWPDLNDWMDTLKVMWQKGKVSKKLYTKIISQDGDIYEYTEDQDDDELMCIIAKEYIKYRKTKFYQSYSMFINKYTTIKDLHKCIYKIKSGSKINEHLHLFLRDLKIKGKNIDVYISEEER